ncbi:RluA family pseudouridine synthase [Breoghania sp.]|uniref:RluA family pseudouridine synthase n=1 Tax=Breoghania sp. TaxID=2065378 RepID=UPI0026196FEB|nr:RluA family pseudouridine synthase [Breoghania sp.]MDJ0931759.1 RluA family pseudouridine synthase [Breoghania sp.]
MLTSIPTPTIAPVSRPFVYDPPSGPLVVLHEDDDILVVAKPSGLLSVPGKASEHADCLIARINLAYPEATLVHRLDCATSGVMVFARNRAAHRHLGLQFERRKLSKSYVARVWGEIAGEEGTVDKPLRCDWPNRPKQMVDFDQGRPAITHWRVEEREAGATRVGLLPETGRSHQLRVHMADLGHPIIGDALYADDAAFAAATRLQLHAETLTIRHPDGGTSMTFVDPCPF